MLTLWGVNKQQISYLIPWRSTLSKHAPHLGKMRWVFFNSRIGSCLPHLIFILARNISDSLIIITHIPATHKYLKICLNLGYSDFRQDWSTQFIINKLALMTPYFMAFYHYIIILKQVRVRVILFNRRRKHLKNVFYWRGVQ